jgi:hypothetical protein
MMKAQIVYDAPLIGIDGLEFQLAREQAGLFSGNQDIELTDLFAGMHLDPRRAAQLLGGWRAWSAFLLKVIEGPARATVVDFDNRVVRVAGLLVTDEHKHDFLYGFTVVKDAIAADADAVADAREMSAGWANR